MNTKLRGDLVEQAAVLQCLKHGWEVLKPIGDRSSYDLVIDVSGVLVKVQVKCAWLAGSSGNYVVDNRRTRTNRRQMVRVPYSTADFDFVLAYIEDIDIFYVFPADVFIGYGSEIHLVEAEKRQRRPRSAEFREAWTLILQWAVQRETFVRSPVKLGEARKMVIPSQALILDNCIGEGVET